MDCAADIRVGTDSELSLNVFLTFGMVRLESLHGPHFRCWGEYKVRALRHPMDRIADIRVGTDSELSLTVLLTFGWVYTSSEL